MANQQKHHHFHFITFRVRHSRGKMYTGYSCLCVCLCLCLSLRHTPTQGLLSRGFKTHNTLLFRHETTATGWYLLPQNLLHFRWDIAEAKCILATAICVSVCLSLAAFPHYCTYPDVSWRNGRGCPLVVHYCTDLRSVNGFRRYDNIAPNAKCERVLVLALCLVGCFSDEPGSFSFLPPPVLEQNLLV